ncbi:hypothetical protein Taro_018236 [Colocasia esculenta]|uniref:CCHC-type domain-containing protein n=1 Tax=Colocasia esculenta TaxID=4460 RepID=A0A843UI78_COLES|nr:hypothetical protein [Colocasia esculenta]
MAKVEGMRGKDNSKPVFVKKGTPNIAPTFRNNNVNNNNKRPNAVRDVAGDKRVKVEGRQLAENCKFCDKPGHRAEECWKKLGECLKCGGRDHCIPDCPMLKDLPGRAQNVPRRQGCLNAVIEADLPEEGGMVEGTISIHSQPAFVLIDTGAAYSFIYTTDEFTTCWGRVEELLGAGELWIDHKKDIFFTHSSSATCTNCPLEADQRRRPCERDGPIGRVLWSCRDSIPRRVLNATKHFVATLLPDLTAPSRSSHPSVAFCSRPVTIITGIRRDLTFGSDRLVVFFICTCRDLWILH